MSGVIEEIKTSIGNYYGHLIIRKTDKGYEWGLNDWSGEQWESIPEELYNAIKNYEVNK